MAAYPLHGRCFGGVSVTWCQPELASWDSSGRCGMKIIFAGKIASHGRISRRLRILQRANLRPPSRANQEGLARQSPKNPCVTQAVGVLYFYGCSKD